MEIKLKVAEKSTIVQPSRGRVVLAANIKIVRERLDKDGNIINPVTHQIIKLAKDL